jgi:RNA polymerase sigma-70 factor (ECF subfamily)
LTFDVEFNISPEEINENTGDAFAELYEQFMPKVYRYINFRIRDEDISQDLTSTVFQKALSKFSGFNPHKASFSTWIFTITRNTVIDYYRVHKKYEHSESRILEYTAAQSPSPEEEVIRTEYTQKLRVFLSRLKKREQDVIILKYSNGMSNREIAEALDLTESNVGSILCRTIRKLRNSFVEWQNE